MFQFDYKRLYQNYVPQNIPNKMIGYSVGGVPVITYVLIGFTTAMLAAVQYLENGSLEKSDSKEDESLTKTEDKNTEDEHEVEDEDIDKIEDDHIIEDEYEDEHKIEGGKKKHRKTKSCKKKNNKKKTRKFKPKSKRKLSQNTRTES